MVGKYEEAKEQYRGLGIDTEQVLEDMQNLTIVGRGTIWVDLTTMGLCQVEYRPQGIISENREM